VPQGVEAAPSIERRKARTAAVIAHSHAAAPIDSREVADRPHFGTTPGPRSASPRVARQHQAPPLLARAQCRRPAKARRRSPCRYVPARPCCELWAAAVALLIVGICRQCPFIVASDCGRCTHHNTEPTPGHAQSCLTGENVKKEKGEKDVGPTLPDVSAARLPGGGRFLSRNALGAEVEMLMRFKESPDTIPPPGMVPANLGRQRSCTVASRSGTTVAEWPPTAGASQ